VVLVAHIGAALRHHYVRKDTVLSRMLPWSTS
jgi:cytochrome b561